MTEILWTHLTRPELDFVDDIGANNVFIAWGQWVWIKHDCMTLYFSKVHEVVAAPVERQTASAWLSSSKCITRGKVCYVRLPACIMWSKPPSHLNNYHHLLIAKFMMKSRRLLPRGRRLDDVYNYYSRIRGPVSDRKYMGATILDPPSWILVMFQLKTFGFFHLTPWSGALPPDSAGGSTLAPRHPL